MTTLLSCVLKRRVHSSIVSPHPKCNYLGANAQPCMLLQNNHLDTSMWSEFEIKQTDIFLASSAKSGSTWMYQIIAQVLYQDPQIDHGYNSLAALCLSPTFTSFSMGGPTKESRIQTIDNINNQLLNANIKHRVFKFHEPVESIPFHPECKYIFVARDYRDLIWSFYNHFRIYSDNIMTQLNMPRYNYSLPSLFPSFDALNKKNGFSEYEFWRMSLKQGDDFGNPDGYPFWSQLWVIGSWLNIAQQMQNIHVVHYNDMKQDLARVIKEVGLFLEVEVKENNVHNLVRRCSFNEMKAQHHKLFGEVGKLWYKEPKDFIYRGINDRWKGVLSEHDIDEYRTLAERYLTASQIKWLEQNY